MKRLLRALWILILISLIGTSTYAQDASQNAIVMQSFGAGDIAIGRALLPGLSFHVAWNPTNSNSWARVDDFGILRFAPIGNSEGVYTFAPSFQGFSTPSLEENRLRMVEAQWSPNGQQLAFRIDSDDVSGSDGIWFWQPAIETSTDPSYHLLRDCPPGCALANSRDTAEWEAISMDWAPDNVAILVGLNLPEEERQAIGIIFASRDRESPQADIQPVTYRYEYGSWAVDGQRIVVSGDNDDEEPVAVYGFINRDGTNPLLNFASDIGLAYVRNAVQNPETGQILMLASTIGKDAPMFLSDNNGNAITPLLGTVAPDMVAWSPTRDAIFVRAGKDSYIATVTGMVYNVTDIVGTNPMVNWVNAGFPANTTRAELPAPLEFTEVDLPVAAVPTVEALPTFTGTTSEFVVGQLLQVLGDSMTITTEPIIGAEVIAEVEKGEALILVGGPLSDGANTWWRIQTLEHTGWTQQAVNGVNVFGQ